MNQTVEILINRVSCKSYKNQPVERALLEQMVAAGLNAPSGMNRQSPRFVAVSDEEIVSQLSRLNAQVMGAATDPFYGAKTVIVVLAKKEGTYLYDGSLAMGNLLNAAFALGLGACWIHRAKEVFESAPGKALLHQWGIEEDVEGIGFCVVGYPQESRSKTPIQDQRVVYIG